MSKRHLHADLIHAWADGAEIQEEYDGSWFDKHYPRFEEYRNFRIKPRAVKREGWVAIYKHFNGVPHLHDCIYASKDDAENDCPSATDIIKIEWEEKE
jgi:hypothetical protein